MRKAATFLSICMLSQYFYPETGATSELVTGIALGLRRAAGIHVFNYADKPHLTTEERSSSSWQIAYQRYKQKRPTLTAY